MKKTIALFIAILISIGIFCSCNGENVGNDKSNLGNVGPGQPPKTIVFYSTQEIEDFIELKDCTESEYQEFLYENESVYSYDMNGMSTPEDVTIFAQNIENGGYPRFTNEDQTFVFTYYPEKENYTFNYYVNGIRYCFDYYKNSQLEDSSAKVFAGKKNIGDKTVDMYKVGENYYGFIRHNDYNIYVFVYKCEFKDIDFSTVVF